MPAFLLIVVGVFVAGFMLATFQQVPLVGCFASSVFYNETRVFGVPSRDPLCISQQLYYVGMIGGFALAGLGAVLALISINRPAQTAPAISYDDRDRCLVSPSGEPPPALESPVVHRTEMPEPVQAMSELRRLVRLEIDRRGTSAGPDSTTS